jgi:hypothetical protein
MYESVFPLPILYSLPPAYIHICRGVFYSLLAYFTYLVYFFFTRWLIIAELHSYGLGDCPALYLLAHYRRVTLVQAGRLSGSLLTRSLSPSYTCTGWETVRLFTYLLITAELHSYGLGDCPALYLLAHYRRVTLVRAGRLSGSLPTRSLPSSYTRTSWEPYKALQYRSLVIQVQYLCIFYLFTDTTVISL